VQPTITDANLVLGYLNPDYFNGGEMNLSGGAAEAIERAIATPLDLTVEQAAWGVHSVANANMERAMRIVSIERGRDPRLYVMVAFGGAGPLHAARLARALEVPKLLVPRGAGVGSALGLLVAKQKIDVSITSVLKLDEKAPVAIAGIFAELEGRIRGQAKLLNRTGELVVERSASMHHVGQGYEIRVDLPPGDIGPGYEETIRTAFYEAYRREYGYTDRESGIEVTDWYLIATVDDGRVAAPSMKLDVPTGRGGALTGERNAYFPEAGGMVPTKIIDRYALTPDDRITGPALVEERESTTVILPGDTITMTTAGNLLIEIGSA
jgi:N-methylhydantoinase A